MARDWMPDARRMRADTNGGPMLGRRRKAVWHTTESDPHETSAADIARYLNRVDYQVHLVWNPITGETVQAIPADRAGRGLRNAAGGTETNQDGEVVIQIEVVGRARDPFTDGPCRGLDAIIDWLRSHDILDHWPAGPPLPYPESYGANGDRRAWERSGHFGHSQVPENTHGDPGAIDIDVIFGDDMPDARDVWTEPKFDDPTRYPQGSGRPTSADNESPIFYLTRVYEDRFGGDIVPVPKHAYSEKYRETNPNFTGPNALSHVWDDTSVLRREQPKLLAALGKLVEMLPRGEGVTPEELRAVLREELADAVVDADVDVTVHGDTNKEQ